MTNSNNRSTQKEARSSERNTVNANYYHKHQNTTNNGYRNGGGHHQRKLNFNLTNTNTSNNSNNNSTNGYHHVNNSNHYQKSQTNSTTFFNNNNASNKQAGRNQSMSPTNKKYGRYTPPNAPIQSQQYQQQQMSTTPTGTSSAFLSGNNGSNKKRRGPGGLNSPLRLPAYYISPVGVSYGIPNTHFNYSKVYDSPSAKTLPPPPEHWTSMSPDELLANEPKFIVEPDEQQPVATIIEKDNGKSAIYIGSSKRCLFDVDRIQIGKSSTNTKKSMNKPNENDGRSGSARVSLGTAAAAAAAAATVISSTNNSDIFTNSLKLLLNIQA